MELDIFNPSRHLRRAVLFWLSTLLGSLSITGIIINGFFDSYPQVALAQGFFCSFSCYVAFKSYKSSTSLILSNGYIYSFIGLISFNTYIYTIDNGVLVWSFLYPVLSYLILGKRYGMLATMVGFVIQLCLIIDKCILSSSIVVWELPLNFVTAFLSVWLASHVLEVKRKTSEASLGQLASRDALTGVYNRHALIHNFERFRQDSKKLPLSLLVLDLDYFKQVNDQYGHDVGDKVLIQTAALIDCLCGEHLVYRIGGEEFCIALNNTDTQNALNKAEEIRSAIESYKFNTPEQPISQTASIGIYQCDHINDLSIVLRNADKELYKAKNNGRNQVMVCHKQEENLAACS
ncbi:GGDEF domain-containing protein [Vibrio zhanjiangensis]|nr:GGDEF domain-containing protein [Vibrio zhanjiangensis]